jgi:2-iminobutanoate/2-iminopropanoate deaminase
MPSRPDQPADAAVPNTPHNPATVFPPYTNYAHAVEVPPNARTLYVSGLNGYDATGATLPADFEGQITNIWSHLDAVLESAGMSYDDLVSLRFFLVAADDDPANVAAIQAHLGDHLAARTVVVQQLLEPGWLVEVEAVAARA